MLTGFVAHSRPRLQDGGSISAIGGSGLLETMVGLIQNG